MMVGVEDGSASSSSCRTREVEVNDVGGGGLSGDGSATAFRVTCLGLRQSQNLTITHHHKSTQTRPQTPNTTIIIYHRNLPHQTPPC